MIANYVIENEKLALPLKKELQALWGNTPVASTISENMSRYYVNGTPEGNMCNLFAKGENVGDKNVAYQVESVVILAHATLSENDMMRCFRKKISMMFGLAPNLFDVTQKLEPKQLMPTNFGGVSSPTFEFGTLSQIFS